MSEAPRGEGLRVALVDPSLFTIPYDEALGGALSALGCAATLWGRRLRPHEERSGALPLEPHFYGLSEGPGALLPRLPQRLLKGAEHALDLVRLARRLAAAGTEIVHLQWAPLPLVDRAGIAALRRVGPVLLTVHDTTPFNGSPAARFQGIGVHGVLGAVDHLVVHTERGRAQLAASGIDPARLSVIPHGTLAGAAPAATRQRDGDAVVLAFGKIKPYKGTDLLLAAFAALPPGLRAQARLRIVGEPQMPMEPLFRQATSLGIADRVDWDLRYVAEAEIPALIAGAAVLAFPYREIDASGVLMAALPQGRPAVASALGAFAELIRDGEHGLLVPPGDVGALAAALGKMLADPARAEAMGCRLAARAADVPGWPEIAARTLELYRRLIAARAQLRPYVSSKRTMSSSPR